MEASGGYERLAFLLLWQAGQPCGLVNARNVRRFAEAMGALEKTDRIDAAMIARFGQARRAAPTPPPSPAQQHLRALVTRLSQVTDDLVANRQRKGAAADPEAVESLEEVIALLLAQRRHLEGEIASLIDDDPLGARLDRAFRQIKGVAERFVARLLAEVPEIGSLLNRAVSKLVGRAWGTRQSGQWKGKSRIGGGRAVVRNRPLHGRPRRRTSQPRPQSLPRQTRRRRKTTQARRHRRRPQAPHNPQRHHPGPTPVEPTNRLTAKTSRSPRRRGEANPARLSPLGGAPYLRSVPPAPESLLPDRFRRWFAAAAGRRAPHQLELLAKARAGRSVLLVAPTGAGKTLAGFLPSLVELAERGPRAGRRRACTPSTSRP